MDAQRFPKADLACLHEPALLSDAHFSLSGERRLVLAGMGDPRQGSRYLGHRIVDNPRDLRAHVQRILLLLAAGDEVTLRASLVDLFIVLGDKGNALKTRMLDCASPLLSKTVAAFLRRHLREGFKPWDRAISTMRMSLLSLGYVGTRELVQVSTGAATTTPVDALAHARACLEYGQLEVAIETLEAANEAFPDDWEVVTALEELYHHSGEGREDRRRPAPDIVAGQNPMVVTRARG